MTAIQEAVPAAAGAVQSRGGEVRNAAAAAGKRVRARKHSGASQNSWQSKLRPYLFIAPLVILSGVFIYYCIGFTVATSFTDWDGISSEMDFIGLKNYTKLLAPGSVFWTALMNNIIFMVVTVVIQAGLGLLLAVILKERLRGSSFFKAIFFMPIAMAPVIIAAIFPHHHGSERRRHQRGPALPALGLPGPKLAWRSAHRPLLDLCHQHL